jgi:hypothetical protein
MGSSKGLLQNVIDFKANDLLKGLIKRRRRKLTLIIQKVEPTKGCLSHP